MCQLPPLSQIYHILIKVPWSIYFFFFSLYYFCFFSSFLGFVQMCIPCPIDDQTTALVLFKTWAWGSLSEVLFNSFYNSWYTCIMLFGFVILDSCYGFSVHVLQAYMHTIMLSLSGAERFYHCLIFLYLQIISLGRNRNRGENFQQRHLSMTNVFARFSLHLSIVFLAKK